MNAWVWMLAGWAALAPVDSAELARAAREERARRERIARPATVIGNEELAARQSLSPVVASATPGAETAAVKPAPPVEKKEKQGTGAEAAAAGPKHDEAYWRERMSEASKRIADLESDLDWAQRRVMMLRMDLVYSSDPMREHNRRVEIDGVMREQADLERELAEARRGPDRVRDEARREGVPPGWLR